MAAALCCGALAASPALADVRVGADAVLTGRVATNPFAATSGSPNTTTVSISPEIAPWLVYEDPDSRVELRGDISVDQYTRIFGTDTTGSADLNIVQRLSPRLNLRGGANYVNSNMGLHNALLNRTFAADAPVLPGQLLPDLSIAGTRTRVQTVGARVGMDYTASELDTFNIDFSGSRTHTSLASGTNYLYGTAAFGYARKISDRTSATLSVKYNKIDYTGQREGDGTIINPLAGIKQQLGPNWSLDIGLGASFSNIKRADGSSENFTVFSGQARICDTFRRGVLCLNAARTAQPTAVSGVTISTDVSLDVDRRLSEHDRVNATMRYSKIEQSSILANTSDFAGIWFNYTHEFNRDFSLMLSPSFSKIFDPTVSRKPNWQMNVAARYRFGDNK